MTESPIEHALASRPIESVPDPVAEGFDKEIKRLHGIGIAAIVLFLVASVLNIWAIQAVSSNAATVTYNKKLGQCLVEQMEEHRVTNLDSHEQIAAGEQPPVNLSPDKRFGGQFTTLSPQDLQRIKDKLQPGCLAVDKSLVGQK